MMDESTVGRDELLIAELHRRGITHLSLSHCPSTDILSDVELIAALAESQSARLNASLILLFLRHPELSNSLPDALNRIIEPAVSTLMLYYQAAVYLQRELEPQLHSLVGHSDDLPDLFSQVLNTPAVEMIRSGTTCYAALSSLGQVHRNRSGWNCIWAGSYRQHISLFLRLLQQERETHPLTHP
jgi:hypothetical protein